MPAATNMVLTWTPQATAPPPVTFNVYRSVAGGPSTQIAAGLTAPTYNDPLSGLTPGDVYSYDVTEVQNGVESAPSTVATATAPFPQPPAPIDLVVKVT